MNLREHENDDGMKVWLSEDEIQTLLEYPDNSQRFIGYALATRCGLRSHEVLEVCPADVVETDAGYMLRVQNGKGDKYRETPVPPQLALQIETADEYRDADSSEPIVDIGTARGMRKWIERDRESLAGRTGDDGWQHLSWHDLRRSWATSLSGADVDPLVVLDWGGWEDLETFLDHYRGTYSPEVQKRQREKVDWL